MEAELLTMDTDNMTSILSYIILKSEIKDLVGQLRLIEEFSSQQQQESRTGHAFTQMMVAAEHLVKTGVYLPELPL